MTYSEKLARAERWLALLLYCKKVLGLNLELELDNQEIGCRCECESVSVLTMLKKTYLFILNMFKRGCSYSEAIRATLKRWTCP